MPDCAAIANENLSEIEALTHLLTTEAKEMELVDADLEVEQLHDPSFTDDF